MSSIPEELHHEILTRLPVESLLVCKSVCRNWYALISTSDFVKSHIAIHKNNNPILMLKVCDERWKSSLYSIGYDSLTSSLVCETKNDAIKMDYPFKSLGYDVKLLGSCDGIICILLRVKASLRGFLCHWNPATREYKEIPKSSYAIKINNVRLSAFGYDHKTDDYKLVLGTEAHGWKDRTLIQVYTLASNSWKSEQTISYQFIPMLASGLLFNGYFHWISIDVGDFLLLSMDISDESFKELQLPKEYLEEMNKDPDMILGVLEGCLCLIVDSYVRGGMIRWEVWKMLDYGARESWTKRYFIADDFMITGYFFHTLLWSFKNGEILLLSCESLGLFDPKHGSARELETLRLNNKTFLGAENYFQSLVSLNSGTFVGREDN